MNDNVNGSEYQSTGLEIAVIGMAGRFPGARNLAEFWENLKDGVESMIFFPDDTPVPAGVKEGLWNSPTFVKSMGGKLEGKESFDATFFGYTPQEAQILNPQTRVFSEVVWNALEDAAYNPFSDDIIIGIFAGSGSSFYWSALGQMSGQGQVLGGFAFSLLVEEEYLCSRLAYSLNLHGPVVFVKSACSTSLVAVHHATQALLSGECEIAIAGGVQVSFIEGYGYQYQEGSVMSKDGHCRAFDADASGMSGGEGSGAVVLKPLKQALEDGDNIHAIIKSTAINNDGNRKVGYTAPSVLGQSEVIQMAHQVAEINAEDISYVETHGTGTTLGDPIEIRALTHAFNTKKRGFCPIGSVKTNVGHLGIAAGIVGLIKVILSLKNRCIPASINFKTPNPKCDFVNSPFYVNAQTVEWKGEYPLRAGLSSFGIGGTNAHMVIEEAPRVNRDRPNSQLPQLLVLSASSEPKLQEITHNLIEFLKGTSGIHFNDIIYTLQVGRRSLPFRKVLLSTGIEEAMAHLSNPDSAAVQTGWAGEENPPVVFMFAGLGSQYINMARDLYNQVDPFRLEMDQCFEIINTLTGENIKLILYPEAHEGLYAPLGTRLFDIEISQLVVFIVEYALAKLLMAWGIKPKVVIGYSFGEYAAACIAGVFSLEEALGLIVTRGSLMKQVPGGVMLSVPMPMEEVSKILPADLSICIDNGPSTIVGGTEEAVVAFEKEMKKRRSLTMRVPGASHAVHSHMMAPILKEFEAAVSQVRLKKPGIPCISNVTGSWLTNENSVNPHYWAKHLGRTVHFAAGVRELLKNPAYLWIEVGPGRDLSALVSRYLEESERHSSGQKVLNLLKPSGKDISDLYYILNRVGRLWLGGVKISWKELAPEEKRYRIPLPFYPFEKQNYWFETKAFFDGVDVQFIGDGERPPETERETTLADWFYLPMWKRSFPVSFPGGEAGKTGHWLIFSDDHGIGERVETFLQGLGEVKITKVERGPGFTQLAPTRFTINPQQGEHYQAFFQEVIGADTDAAGPVRILHLWNMSNGSDTMDAQRGNDFETGLYNGFYSAVYIARAIAGLRSAREFQFNFIADHLFNVTGSDLVHPVKGMVQGILKVIPQEYPNIRCRCIDACWPGKGEWETGHLVRQLVSETANPEAITDVVLAFRGTYRLVQHFDPISLPDAKEGKKSLTLRERGVYLITGGLGDIGIMLARFLKQQVNARLILTRRSPLPPREQWQGNLKRLLEIEAMGEPGDLMIAACDVADQEEMKALVTEAEKRWGNIHGVIHAAGTVNMNTFQSVAELNRDMCDLHFRSKVRGTENLVEIFKGKYLDFLVLISSISVVLGGLRFSAYASANAFIDGYLEQMEREMNTRVLCVDWDGMPEENTIDAFKRMLAHGGLTHVVAANGGNLPGRIDQWVKLKSFAPVGEQAQKRKTMAYPRPQLMTAFVAPKNEQHKIMAEIWQELFGYDRVGIEDDFLDLGGDSLRAITVIARIHQRMNAEIPLAVFFSHPTIEQLTTYIESATESRFISIQPAENKELYEISPAQKRLFILQEMEKNNTVYNQPQVMWIDGEVDSSRLLRTFRQLIERHESLRTSIRIVNGKPYQRVHGIDEITFDIEYYDTPVRGEMEKEAMDASINEIIKNFVRPFDLSIPPFIRLGLLPIRDNQNLVLFDMHHIITDGVSYEILLREFGAFYNGESLPTLALHYKDYTEWHASRAHSSELRRQESYWLKEFSEEVPVLRLPYDFPRPPVQSFSGSNLGFEIGEDVFSRLKSLAAERNTTLFAVLLAVYYILLSKLSGQDDIVVGTPVVGRRHSDLQDIIGMFVNTLALRNRPLAYLSYLEFLEQIKPRLLEAFDNQDFQFEELVEKVKITRDTGRNPLFDVAFVLNYLPEQAQAQPPQPEQGEVVVQPYEMGTYTSKFDLNLTFVELDDRLRFIFEYCTRLFVQGTIERFIEYFKRVVASVVHSPDQPIWAIDILSEEEKDWLLTKLNMTDVAYPREDTLDMIFTRQVEKTPGQPALLWGEVPRLENNARSMTYGELNQLADELAIVLKEKGVTPDTIVGILVDRSLDMVIAILGIIKAGGAYMPMDPQYPTERIQFMLADSGTPVLITEKGGLDNLNIATDENGGPAMIYLDELMAQPAGKHPQLPGSYNKPANLAYVIYTSGTTGKPKGVLIEHRNVVRLLFNDKFQFNFNDRDVWTLFHSYCFDFSVWEMYGALLYGGQLVIVPRMVARDPRDFRLLLKDYRVTVLNQTPSAFYNLIHEDLTSGSRDLELRYIIFGGEALNPAKLNQWFERYPATRLINMYGITETCVHVTYKEIAVQEIAAGVSNIGTAIPTLSTYIMDSHQRLMPPGSQGELCVGGLGVARGYLNRPELTAERFVDNPYKKGERLYKSGDLANLLPSGEMEYLGRIDQQVQIRGFRVEMGEIENRIQLLPSVSKVVVLDRHNEQNGDIFLVAYIVPQSPGNIENSETNELKTPELRTYLNQFLPDYMIPSYFVLVKEIPLTSNGKVDRKALLSLELTARTPETSYSPPETELEAIVADTWKEMLQIDKIGRTDNYFDLGGNSFNLVLISRKLEERFGVKIPLVTVFEHPTLEAFCRFLSGELKTKDSGEPVKDESQETRTMRSETRISAKQTIMKQKSRRRERGSNDE